MVMTMIACSEDYDDSELRSDIENLENRVNTLEQWQKMVNNDLSSLQSIVNSLNGNDNIVSVDELKDSAGKVIGYRIEFAKSGTKDIYHGKDGANGTDGEPGSTPAIGVKIDSDGIYYWTLNGTWLLDESGNKVKTGTDGMDGANGKDGVTPQLKIENNLWFVSYDNGGSWKELGQATTEVTGTGLFSNVVLSEEYVTFVLTDGNQFAVPLTADLSIKLENVDNLLLLPNSTIEIDYEITSSTGKVDIELIASSDLMSEIIPEDATNLKGKIKIIAASTLSKQPKIVLLATNGTKMLMRSIEFEQDALIEITDNTQKQIAASGGELLLEYFSNVECEIIIPEDAKGWISTTGTRAVTLKSVILNIAKNEGNKRSALITLKSVKGDLKAEYTIVQDGNNSFYVNEENTSMPCAGMLTVEYAPDNASYSVSNMVDNDYTTYYETSQSKFDIIWEGEKELSFKEFLIDFGSDNSKQPEGVSVYISNDGIVWQSIVGYGTSGSFGRFQREFPTKTRTKYVKFEINDTSGSSAIQVTEFHLTANEDVAFASFAEVEANGSNFTYTASTPMGTHYENKHVTTEEDKVWLATATNEPNLLESASNYTLREYSVSLYPNGDPLPADVNQHGIGDCSALAVFAEMAYLFPDFIKSIITDHKDGTYTVAMFDPQGQPVDVRVQSTFLGDNNGIGAVSGKKGEATWATIMEKAIMKWNYIYQVNPEINGIGSEHVAPLFTGEGNSFAYNPNSLIPQQLKRAVELSLEERMIVIGGFNVGGLWAGTGQTVTAHAYSFMYSQDETALFSMRNPWGNSPGSDGSEDGVLNIYDDGSVPPTIDLRIIYPGKAKQYAKTSLSPYIPPVF